MAELADALDLGSSTFGVQVRLLLPAPIYIMKGVLRDAFFAFKWCGKYTRTDKINKLKK